MLLKYCKDNANNVEKKASMLAVILFLQQTISKNPQQHHNEMLANNNNRKRRGAGEKINYDGKMAKKSLWQKYNNAFGNVCEAVIDHGAIYRFILGKWSKKAKEIRASLWSEKIEGIHVCLNNKNNINY